MIKTKEKWKKNVGMVLRRLRQQKSREEEIRLTQTDIAEESEVSVRYYNKLENGLSMPTIDILAKIANTYKMSLSEICKQIEEEC